MLRTNEELLKEIYNLQKESSERDTKLETTIMYMDKRLETMEDLTSKMSETLNKQQLISAQVASLATEITDIKTNMVILNGEVKELKTAKAKAVYDTFRKIFWIIVPMILASVYAWLIKKGGK